jgi:hypothetical protein
MTTSPLILLPACFLPEWDIWLLLTDTFSSCLDDVEKNFLTVSTVISVDLAALDLLHGEEQDSKSIGSTQPEVWTVV